MKRMSIIIMYALLLVSCGIGTEVGNGFKPGKGPGEGEDRPKSASSDPSNGAPVGDAAAPQSGAGGNDGESVDDAKSDADPSSGSGQDARTFDTTILHAKCASPFANAMVSPIRIVEAKDGAKPTVELKAEYSRSTKKWSITEVTANSAVTIYGEVDAVHTCSEAAKTEEVQVDWYAAKVRRTTAKFIKGGVAQVLVWYETKPATVSDLPKLLRVEATFGPSLQPRTLVATP